MKKLTYKEITCEKVNGFYVCAAIVKGHYVRHKFLYHTKKQALTAFRQYVNSTILP